MQAAMNIKQFTYEVFDSVASTANLAGNFLADSIRPKPKADAAEIQLEREVELAPPAPTFSTDELEMAKSLAREEGVSQGYEQAKKQFEDKQAAADSKLADMVANLSNQLAQISEQVAERKTALTKDFADLALSLAKQICNNLPEETLTAQLESVINESLAGLDEGQKVKITLNPKNAAELNGKFTGAELKTSEEMAAGDFRIEWQNGYLERDTKKLWSNMEGILSKHFANSAVTENNTDNLTDNVTENTTENPVTEQGE